LICRRLIVPLTLAVVALHTGQAFAQDAFPAPQSGQADVPVSSATPVPPMNRTAPYAFINGAPAPFALNGGAPISGSASERDACMTGFGPLREEAEKRGKLIKAAGERKASPDEACKLIGSFGQAEHKMIKYVETNSAKCGIPPQIAEQLKTGHNNTEKMQKQVCAAAQQAKWREPAGLVGDFWPASGREPAGPVGDFWIVR
jgi:hypothetical protein